MSRSKIRTTSDVKSLYSTAIKTTMPHFDEEEKQKAVLVLADTSARNGGDVKEFEHVLMLLGLKETPENFQEEI